MEQDNFEKQVGWERPQSRDVSEVSLVENNGGTVLKIGWGIIEGKSSTEVRVSMTDMLKKVFSLMSISSADVDLLISKYSLKEEIEDVNVRGVTNFKVSINDLIKDGIFSDQYDARTRIKNTQAYFLE